MGVALANKLKNSKAKTIVFLGDGTLGQGVVYESLNMAVLHGLNIVFVVEDKYAMSTKRSDAFAGDIRTRLAGFGIESREITSTKFEELDSFFKDVFLSPSA